MQKYNLAETENESEIKYVRRTQKKMTFCVQHEQGLIKTSSATLSVRCRRRQHF